MTIHLTRTLSSLCMTLYGPVITLARRMLSTTPLIGSGEPYQGRVLATNPPSGKNRPKQEDSTLGNGSATAHAGHRLDEPASGYGRRF